MSIVIVTPFFNEKLYNKNFEPRSSLISLVGELSKYIKITIISSKIGGAKNEEIINSNLKIYRFKPTFFFPKLPYVIDLFQIKKILKICRLENCTVLIGNSLQFFSCFSAAIAAILSNYTFICRIIGASETTKNFGINILSKIYDFTLAKIILKIANKIFVQTKSMQNRPLKLGALSSKISIIEDGVDLNQFQFSNKLEYLKNELGLKESNIVITFVSRLYRLKGIEDLIDVAIKLIRDFNDIIFLIAGAGPLRAKLEHQTRLIERIRFLGYRNDVPDLLKLSDIFILPSYSEGLSPAILEAFASGLPVITTNVGSNPDIIINGKNGFLIQPGDNNKMKKYLSILIENKDLRVSMGDYNKKLIRDRFDLKKTALNFLNGIKILNIK